ncbi:hypothetical protein ACVWWD_003540 [Mesorhizobium sp. URHB0026]
MDQVEGLAHHPAPSWVQEMVDKSGGFTWANWAPKDWISLTSAKSMSAARLVAPSPAPFLFLHRPDRQGDPQAQVARWRVARFQELASEPVGRVHEVEYGDYVTRKQNRIRARL